MRLRWAAIIPAALAFGCGSASKDDGASALDGKIKQTFFGKSLYVDDELYKASCNYAYIKFMINEASPECAAVVVDTKVSSGALSWGIKSPDGKINFSVVENEADATVSSGMGTFHCLLYTGKVYGADGTRTVLGSHLILSSVLATKPSELSSTVVLGIGTDSQTLCDSRF